MILLTFVLKGWSTPQRPPTTPQRHPIDPSTHPLIMIGSPTSPFASANQSIHRSTNWKIEQSSNQCIQPSITQPLHPDIIPSTTQSLNPWVNPSIDQSINSSIIPSTRPPSKRAISTAPALLSHFFCLGIDFVKSVSAGVKKWGRGGGGGDPPWGSR